MIDLGRDICSDPAACTEKEWLVTNGIGGFAFGTVSGALTRCYHALLNAALKPPLGRTTLVTKVDDTVTYNGQTHPLYCDQRESADHAIAPQGYRYLNTFHMAGTAAVWQYSVDDALLEKRVWMAAGENTTYVRYRLLRASLPLTLEARILINYKDMHDNTHADDWQMTITPIERGLRVDALEGAVPFYLLSPDTNLIPAHTWRKDYFLMREAYRGLDDLGDHLEGAHCTITLAPGESLLLVFSTEANASLDGDAAEARRFQQESQLLTRAGAAAEPDWIQQLVLAADQFIVQRRTGDNPDGRTVIAGYPWFSDWGRDTMIALPGLTLAAGRYAEAALILRTFAGVVDQGMLPNRFPDSGDAPEYNTVDATLWYFEAIRAYLAITDDQSLLRDLYPILKDIITWHQRGTRYSIHVDPADHLLYSGEAGVQLTWMDVKIKDWVVTPRTGKAVEINALWYNALRSMAAFAALLGHTDDVHRYTAEADQVKASFARFWNADTGWCFDVLDTPEGTHDATLRPNQLFAVSLHHSPLPPEQQRAVVNVCAQHLYTPHGLRSLAPFEPGYVGVYGGDIPQRDSAYHQGTVWGWLIGPFVEAYLRVYQSKPVARTFLLPFYGHLRQQGIGTIAEIFDGDAPHLPRGCVAQAWSVAEVLRAWRLTSDH
ncbi:MAG: amylo-alpha-1,6-glucosidase [Anaerolineae bacterium]